MIAVEGLTKRFGVKTAVEELTFQVAPGRVTGFLGPNGAGKSTTLRIIVGLTKPDSGTVLLNGRSYHDLGQPLREVGAMIDAKSFHGGRSAFHHLLALAQSNQISTRRVEEVLGIVGLEAVAGKRTSTYSLGMGQRLGLAAALLGDPGILILDEPVNGLDVDGVLWLRGLLRSFAEEGRTVFISSHMISEMQSTADHLVLIGRGQLLANGPASDVINDSELAEVTLRSPDVQGLDVLQNQLHVHGVESRRVDEMRIKTTGTPIETVADFAYEMNLRIHEISCAEATLEQAYLKLTDASSEYRSSGTRNSPEASREEVL